MDGAGGFDLTLGLGLLALAVLISNRTSGQFSSLSIV